MKKEVVTKSMIETILVLDEMKGETLGYYVNPNTKKRFNVIFNEDESVSSISWMQMYKNGIHYIDQWERELISHYGMDFEYVKSIINNK